MEAALILLEVFPPPLLERPALQTVTALLPHRGRTVSRERALSWYTVRSVEKLPEDSELLGLLERNDGASLYTDSEEYAGCEVWEDGSGFHYVQMPDGTFAQAELVQP
mgnify:CR=1 FL=1